MKTIKILSHVTTSGLFLALIGFLFVTIYYMTTEISQLIIKDIVPNI